MGAAHDLGKNIHGKRVSQGGRKGARGTEGVSPLPGLTVLAAGSQVVLVVGHLEAAGSYINKLCFCFPPAGDRGRHPERHTVPGTPVSRTVTEEPSASMQGHLSGQPREGTT